jgi:hypothetical protein
MVRDYAGQRISIETVIFWYLLTQQSTANECSKYSNRICNMIRSIHAGMTFPANPDHRLHFQIRHRAGAEMLPPAADAVA